MQRQKISRALQEEKLNQIYSDRGPLGFIPDEGYEHYHELGYERQLKYNSKRKCMTQRCSNLGAAGVAQFGIYGPTLTAIVINVWMCSSEVLDKEAKMALTILLVVTCSMSLSSYYAVMFSDPGIIPAVHMNSKITDTRKFKADANKVIYVQY